MKVPDTGKIMGMVYLAGFVIALFVVYKIMKGVGLIKSASKERAKAEQEAAVEMLRTDDYFSPDYYKGRKFKPLGSNTSNVYAQALRKAMRGIGTDEESIYTTFNKLYNKCNVSEVAESYFIQYGKDLQTDLLNDLGKKEVTQLMNIINALPGF